jgi:hypothetical protein
MNKNFKPIRHCLALAGLLLLSGISGHAATPQSPVGNDWDCLISGGSQQGIAYLTFSGDNTFVGYRVLVGKNLTSIPSTPEGRNSGGDDGRTGTSGSSTNSSTSRSVTNLFGFDRVHGDWQFDDRGRIIGRFVEVVGGGQTVCTTNENITTVDSTTTVPVTNPDGSVTYYTTNVTIFVTNAATVTCVTNTGTPFGVSFLGKAVTGKRLSLAASTVNGKITYSGIPARTDLPDLSGSWSATKLENQQWFYDTFSLTSFADGNPFPENFPDVGNYKNIYFSIDGTEPNAVFEAIGMLSARKKIGFVFSTSPVGSTNSSLSATLGSLSKSKTYLKANTSGLDLGLDPAAKVTFKAFHLISPD